MIILAIITIALFPLSHPVYYPYQPGDPIHYLFSPKGTVYYRKEEAAKWRQGRGGTFEEEAGSEESSASTSGKRLNDRSKFVLLRLKLWQIRVEETTISQKKGDDKKET